MNTKELTAWLRRSPRPVAVLADNQRVEVSGGRAWKTLAATIESLEPSKLVCLNGQGNVIRSVVLDEDEEKPAAVTVEETEIETFARLLADATNAQPVLTRALDFIDRQAVRLAKAEAEIESLRVDNAKLRHRNNELTLLQVQGEGGDDMSVMDLMMQGMLAGQQQKQKKPRLVETPKEGAK